MRLEREALVRSLHKIPPADAHDLARHSSLIGITPHVLYHGVREDHVERFVAKLRHRSGVADGADEMTRSDRLMLDVEQRHANVAGLSSGHQVPEFLRASDVEYLDVSIES